MRRFAVILAGGKGERLWPLSTPERPKAFLELLDGRSLIQSTYDRLRLSFALEEIYVLLSLRYTKLVRKQLPELPAQNLLVEPEAKDTAFAVAHALKRIPEGVVGFFPADHYVAPHKAFARDVQQLYSLAADQAGLFTLGIAPTYPATGYGYMQRGERVAERAYKVARFLEKPDHETAKALLREGCFWNTGIYAAQRSVWVEEYQRHAPEVWRGLGPRISLDYALSEKSGRVYLLEASFSWDDLGDWAAVARHARSVPGVHRLESEGSFVWSSGNETILLVGVPDLILVRHGRSTLVLPKERAGDLKLALALLGGSAE